MATRLLSLGIAVAAAGMSAAAPPPQPKAGAPLPGLTPNQLLLFHEGLEYYRRDITVEEGLGPAFNQPNCAACHESPIGGWGGTSVQHFARVENGQFNFLESLGGPVRQRQAISTACLEQLPAAANHVRERVTPSVLAFGLVEAVPDAALIALEDPNDADGDGISGRAHRVHLIENPTGPLRIGRFGWKSQIASVLSFSGDAARTEMGLTNAVVPVETPPNGNMGDCDTVPEIEDRPDANGLTFVQAVTAFQRYLAPPPQAPRGGMTGEAIFNAVGCAKCHVTTLQTGNGPELEEVLRNKTIRVYSDFLLHDMGALADGIPDGEALPTEMRTPPLWNLRTRPVMLHDGSAAQPAFADRVTAAIASHAGEGLASRNAFLSLQASDKAKMIAFLDSLGRDDYDVNGDSIVDRADYDEILAHVGDADVSPDEPWAVADLNQNRRIDTDELQQLADSLGVDTDCNQNSQPDWVDIAGGLSSDADGNFTPDECPSPAQCNLRVIRVQGGGGPISNFATVSSSVSVNRTGAIKGLRLTIDIKHDWVNDLQVRLRRGSTTLLAFSPCGGAADIDGKYSFIQRNWWNPGAVPAPAPTMCSSQVDRGPSFPPDDRIFLPAGTYERAMRSSFENQSPTATWQLEVVDGNNPGGNNTGVLRGWTLEILYEAPAAEWDCNDDGLPDCGQIDLDPSLDCDGDGEIDSCQLAGSDCDGNGVLDRCQVASGLDGDCDEDGVLDACEADADSDGVPDACDGCPNNGGLIVPGPCGCGSLEGDSDNDGTPNCSDGCPNDPAKTSPGACGCGNPDVDGDGDGALDCNDGCPGDPAKTSPGACGCGVTETDTDGDGSPDCIDGCPADPAKNAPGVCGCGTPDTDGDGDGTPDCADSSNEAARLVATLDPTQPVGDGSFGSAVRSDGSAVIVGAVGETAGGVARAGAAYVFSRDTLGNWTQPARLVAPTPEPGSLFGYSVAIDGDIAVVGAPEASISGSVAAGRAFVYRRSGDQWQLEQALAMASPCAGCSFGTSVAASAGRVFVSASGDLVGGSVRVFDRVASTWSQSVVLTSSDASGGDRFGSTIAAYLDTLVVAAVRDDAGGVLDRGSAYVFMLSGTGQWSQQAKLEPSVSGAGNTFFGNDIDVVRERVVVGANAFDIGGPDRGAAFVYRRVTGGGWTQESILVAPDAENEDKFGFRVAIGADGLSVAASAPQDNIGSVGNSGTCRLFRLVGDQWRQQVTITTPQVVDPDGFGSAIAMSADLLVSAAPLSSGAGLPMSGRAFVFDTAPLDCNGDGVPDTDSDGDGIADCSDGDDDGDGASDLVDGCPSDPLKVAPGQCGCGSPDTDSDADGSADCVDECPGDPLKSAPGACGCGNPDTDADADGTPDCVDSGGALTADLPCPIAIAGAQFGWSAAIDGGFAISGAPEATIDGAASRGMAAIFRRAASGEWVTDGVITAPNGSVTDRFGARVGLHGDIAVIAAPQARENRGSVYVYRRAGSGSWVLQQVLQPQLPPSSFFGRAVAVADGVIAVGAPNEGIGGAVSQGAVYVYAPSGPGQWSLEAKLVAADGAANDEFGHSVAIRNRLLVCGMPFDDTGAVLNHGSAYVFRRLASNAWQLRGKIAGTALVAGARFGREISTDGITVAANAPEEAGGAAYLFTVGAPQDSISAATRIVSATAQPDDAFGCGVAVSGSRVAVGALLDDIGGAVDAGSVRVFTRSSQGAWSETDTVTLPGGRPADLFGWVVALDRDSLAVGAVGADSGAVADRGSLSIFDLSPMDCDDDGSEDQDTDGDRVADCNDRDDDGDGTPDSLDGCPLDPLKTSPGTCGCGQADSTQDVDGDGAFDCVDNCPSIPNPSQSDCDGDGQGDACEQQVDCNGNGISDSCDIVSGGSSSDFNANGVPDECEAATLLVPSEFPTIQAAIDAAPAQGGIVLVSPGVYIGAVNARGKAVKIHAPGGPALTVIDGAAVPQSLVTFASGEGPATLLSGFSVRRGAQGTPIEPGSPFLVGGGIFVNRASPTIVNCRISQCRGQYGAGMYLYFSSSIIEDCQFLNNAAIEDGGGVLAYGADPRFLRCEFAGNVSGVRGAGAHVVGGSARFESCDLRDNVVLGSGGGISWDTRQQPGEVVSLDLVDTALEFNFALDVGGGLWVWTSAGGPVQRPATLLRSRLCGNVPDEINGPSGRDVESVICVDCNLNGIPDADDIASNGSLDCDLSGTIDSCDIASGAAQDRNGNGTVDDCETGTLFVPSEFPTVTAAIQSALPGTTVWIAPGTYSEAIDPMGKAITIRGGGPGTVIDGTLLSTSILTVKNGEGTGTVIEDLVFRNGRVGSSIVLAPTFRGGGGAYIENASPTIRRCVFEQCRAEYGGGGYFVGFDGLLEDCVFRSNTALADGGGLQVFNRFGTPPFPGSDIVNCVFEQNVAGVNGGGLHLVDFNGHRLVDCTVTFNEALGTSNPWNAFFGVGGGISWFQIRSPQGDFGLPLVLDGCIVEDNGASIDGGGLFVHNLGLAADVIDSVFCGNSPTNISGEYDDLGGNELCNPCLGDLSGDGVVSGTDLGLLLGQWGASGPNFADLSGDGSVSGADMGILLGAWGPCGP